MSAGPRPLDHIVIAGGHVAGWTVAAALARSLAGLRTRITLIELPEPESFGPVVATLPKTPTFHDHLQIDEAELMRGANGSFRAGTRYDGWRRSPTGFFHAYGTHGSAFGIVPFHHFAVKMMQAGEHMDFNDYSLTSVAARLGRFMPTETRGAPVPSYGINFDSGLYAGYMQDYALRLGVSVARGSIDDVSIRGSDGFIESVTLADGVRLHGDFFVDCSGDEARLASLVSSPVHDWSHWLPCDRAVSAATGIQDSGLFTSCSALDRGWRQRILLQDTLVHELAWCSRYLDEGGALDLLESGLAGPAQRKFHTRPVHSGLRRPWNRNCIAFGRAAGGFEPLEQVELQLLHSATVRLLGMFPDASGSPLLADEYNRITTREYENVRDFLLLRYRLSERGDSAFWQVAKGIEIPDSLRHRIELFLSRGRLVHDEFEIFSKDSWVSMMIGNGLVPAGYDPLVDTLDIDRIRDELQRMRQAIRRTAEALPEKPPS
jgi:tryptophan halogenase